MCDLDPFSKIWLYSAIDIKCDIKYPYTRLLVLNHLSTSITATILQNMKPNLTLAL